jgi:undecaprenyl-diphosphatase
MEKRGFCLFASFWSAVGALALGLSFGSNWQLAFDRTVTQAVQASSWDGFYRFITNFGTTKWLLIFSVAFALASLLRRKYDGLLTGALTLGTWLFNIALKNFYARPRPFAAEETGFSFPSGHAMVGALFYLSLILSLSRGLGGAWRRALLAGGILFVLWLGLSRVYLGVHYPTDVLAGLLWALSLLCLRQYFVK